MADLSHHTSNEEIVWFIKIHWYILTVAPSGTYDIGGQTELRKWCEQEYVSVEGNRNCTSLPLATIGFWRWAYCSTHLSMGCRGAMEMYPLIVAQIARNGTFHDNIMQFLGRFKHVFMGRDYHAPRGLSGYASG